MDHQTKEWADTVPQNTLLHQEQAILPSPPPSSDSSAVQDHYIDSRIERAARENDRLSNDANYRSKKKIAIGIRAGLGILLLLTAGYLLTALLTLFSSDPVPAFLYPGKYLLTWGMMTNESWGFLTYIPRIIQGIVAGILIIILITIGMILMVIASIQGYKIYRLKSKQYVSADGSIGSFYASKEYKTMLARQDRFAQKFLIVTIVMAMVFWLLPVFTAILPSTVLERTPFIAILLQQQVKYGSIILLVIALLFFIASHFGSMILSWRKVVATLGWIVHLLAAPLWLITHI